MATVYGERVRQIRELKGWTQSELADRVGVKQATISQVEAGKRQPSSDNVEALALVTGFPPRFFRKPPGPEFPLGSLLWRAQRSATQRQLKEAHRYAELEYELTLGLRASFDPVEVRLPDLTSADPIQAAQETRSSLGLSPDRPIANLTYTLEQCGVIVLALPLSLKKRDGFTAWAGDFERLPVVSLPAGVPGDRRRFSIAHELKHLVVDRGRRGYTKEVERDADRFAGELLMPGAAIESEITVPVTLSSLTPLKKRWGVSVESLILRARDLGLMSEGRVRHLFQRLHRWSPPPGYDIQIEKPRMLRKMAESLYGNPINVRRMAADFDLPAALIRAILEAHAARHDLVKTVPDAVPDEKVIAFRPRAATN